MTLHQLDADSQLGAIPASKIPGASKEVFTSSGVFNVPAGVTQIFVTLVGGGGGGGAGNAWNGVSHPVTGSGGGAGQGWIRKAIDVTPLEAITVTIGAGGEPANSWGDVSPLNGPNGTDSSLGSYLTAKGGQGGSGGYGGGGTSYGGGVGGGPAGGSAGISQAGGHGSNGCGAGGGANRYANTAWNGGATGFEKGFSVGTYPLHGGGGGASALAAGKDGGPYRSPRHAGPTDYGVGGGGGGSSAPVTTDKLSGGNGGNGYCEVEY